MTTSHEIAQELTAIERLHRELAQLKDKLQSIDDDRGIHKRQIDDKKKEIKQREIEVYWLANPGLRIEVGDRIDMTEVAPEYLRNIASTHWQQAVMTDDALIKSNYQFTVSAISTDIPHLLESYPDKKYALVVSLDVLRKARETWLKRNPHD